MRTLFLALALAVPALVVAAEPTALPVLQIETGMHTGLIRKLALDAAHQKLATVADDKTLRVWQLPSIRLLATYRMPINRGNEGQLVAVAFAPDGAAIATGGWTGWDWDKRGCVYLIDATSGSITRRLSGFPNIIASLAFSADGKYLAVGLQGKGGLYVLRVPEFKVVARDPAYADKVVEMDFDRSGRLAVSSLDGFVRLYTEEFKLRARKRLKFGNQPTTLRFAPDGQRLAVGFSDSARIAVLSAYDLSALFSPDLQAVRDQRNLPAVTWAQGGERLCAAGEYRGTGRNPLYCWDQGGRGEAKRTALVQQRFSDLHGLASGDIVFAAEDPVIGIAASNGLPGPSRASDIIDWSATNESLNVSADASVVQFRAGIDRSEKSYFNVDEPERPLNARQLSSLQPPLRASAHFVLDAWQGSARPVVNGRTLELESYEAARSYAIAADEHTLLLGTEWALRSYNRELKLNWMVPLTAVARSVNVSADGKIGVAALSDGTLRWYRMNDGAELLALFVHAGSKDWICWIPAGYYMSSPLGDNYIGWQLNRGKEIAPDFYRAVQFERLLYRPDLVLAHFRGKGDKDAASLTRGPGFDIASLAAIAPPTISAAASRDLSDGKAARIKLQISAAKSVLPMREYSIFVNGLPITPAPTRRLQGADAERFVREVEIDLPARENAIRVEVFNGAAMAVSEFSIESQAQPQPQQPAARGDLYVLAIGVNQYANLPSKYTLRFAANDAEAIAANLERFGGALFGSVHALVVSDRSAVKPQRAEVLAALSFLERAGPNDTLVVFLAAHGISDAAGNYYFVPGDAAWSDVQSLLRGEAPKGKSLIAWTSFFEALRNALGKRLLIVDTCQARSIEGTFDVNSLAKRSAASQFALMVAAQSEEESQEYRPAQHGLFTYGVLQGLAGTADADGDGVVRLHELFAHALPIVRKLGDPALGTQTPQLIAPARLRDMALGAVPVRNAGSAAPKY